MGKISKVLSPGDIVVVNLDPTIGHEKQKTRACLVIEAGGSPLELIIVLPVTEHQPSRNPSFFVPILNYRDAGLIKPSAVDCYQIRTLSLKRLKSEKRHPVIVGQVSKEILHEVRIRLALILDITQEHVKDIEYLSFL